jgi:hypothetical protein
MLIGFMNVPSRASLDVAPPTAEPGDDGIPEDAERVDSGRLDSCGSDSLATEPCYYEVYRATSMVAPAGKDSASPLAALVTKWYICGVKVYNYNGTHVGTLTNNTQTSYDPATQIKPWKLLQGYNTTWASSGYKWSLVTGPTPTPGWNVWADTAKTRSTGRFGWVVPNTNWYTELKFGPGSGWTCRGGQYY